MLWTNAVKKLTKNGFTITQTGNFHYAHKDGFRDYLQMIVQNGEISLIDVKRQGWDDDPQTDYHAGVFADNLAQALRLVQK